MLGWKNSTQFDCSKHDKQDMLERSMVIVLDDIQLILSLLDADIIILGK